MLGLALGPLTPERRHTWSQLEEERSREDDHCEQWVRLQRLGWGWGWGLLARAGTGKEAMRRDREYGSWF